MTSPISSYQDTIGVVTGGASGVGRSLCDMLLERGASVVCADIQKDRIDETVEDLSGDGRTIVGLQVDVTEPGSVESLAAQTFERFGKVNLLFNNAGVGAPSAKVWETTPNDWSWVTSVNLFGVAYGIQSFVPRMLESGAPGVVVNTTSGNGAVTIMPSASVYAASKAGVAAITESLEAQFREVEADLTAALLFPAGRGLMGTGMWTADRNRHSKWEREAPRPKLAPEIEKMREKASSMIGQFTEELDELANAVLDGILAGHYVLTLGDFDGSVAALRERADRYEKLENPTVPSGR